jgi:taurine--2-oxoglutarate transaminase
MPLGAVAMSDKIADYFRTNTFYGGLTYNAHPMCLAAAIETIKVMEDEDLVGNAKRMGVVMSGLLDDLKAEHSSVGDVRSIGLFGAIELVTNRDTKAAMPAREVGKAAAYLKEHGLYHFTPGNLIFTNPPLIVNEAQLKAAFNVINEALSITDKAVR